VIVARGGTLRLAHRGDRRRAPENSLEAMTAALAIPRCDGLEFDVQTSADGVPILLHDATLQRVRGRSERPDQLSAAALGALGIPTLASVLDATPAGAFLDVELKVVPGQAFVDVMVAARGPDLRGTVVSSFAPDVLERVAGLAPSWPRWLNAAELEPETISTAVELGCRAVSVEWRAIDARSMGRARSAGLDVAAFTVDRRSTFGRLARLGVVAACVEGAALDG